MSTAEIQRTGHLPEQRIPARVFAIIRSGVILANLDLFIVNVALPDIGTDLGHASLEDLSWMLNAYTITYAALLVLCGRVARAG